MSTKKKKNVKLDIVCVEEQRAAVHEHFLTDDRFKTRASNSAEECWRNSSHPGLDIRKVIPSPQQMRRDCSSITGMALHLAARGSDAGNKRH